MFSLTNTMSGLGKKKKGWTANLLAQLLPDVEFCPVAVEVVVEVILAVEVTLVAGNTCSAMMFPMLVISYMRPP